MSDTALTEPEKFDLRSHDVAADRRAELLRVFPEIRTEGGKLDFDRLRAVLGEAVDVGKERYGLNWPGKAECFRTIQAPSLATLRPCPEESYPPKAFYSRGDAEARREKREESGSASSAPPREPECNDSENLIIEGDNLEVLKLLQKSYLGKVKMIYIDPPYNTGNDFIYPDNYTESLRTYLEYTGQVDSEGRRFGTNTEADGRFHSKWLNMMYPRLYLARNLLREDGFVFITIDDEEVANLRAMCNEVFGEENFIANVVWQKKYTRSNDAKYFSDNHDHILVYARAKDTASLNLQQRTEDQTAAYTNPDNHPKGPWKATPLHAKSGSVRHFEYTFKNGVTWSPPPGTFPRFSAETLARLDGENEIWFGSDGGATPSRKTFLSEAKPGVTPTTIWTYDEVGHNHEANNELKAIGLAAVFDNPKPTRLIRRMLELSTNADDEHLVLDFFAGSGSTAQAVLDANASDGGNRRFFVIQLPEPTGHEDFPTIAHICKERVRRTIKRLTADDNGKLNIDAGRDQARGFRVFKLDESNFTTWDAHVLPQEGPLLAQLERHVHHIREGRSVGDILCELLLKSGCELAAPVETLTLAGKTVYSADGGKRIICLDRKLTLELIRTIAALAPERVVCLDEGFAGNDQLKVNAAQTFKNKGVTSFKTV
jgi:adenine-specific DNA-methyltransferase